MDDFVRVAKTSDLAENEIMLVEVGDARIVLSNIEGSFYAIGEVCTHAEGPLSEGDVEEGEVECVLDENSVISANNSRLLSG